MLSVRAGLFQYTLDLVNVGDSPIKILNLDDCCTIHARVSMCTCYNLLSRRVDVRGLDVRSVNDKLLVCAGSTLYFLLSLPRRRSHPRRRSPGSMLGHARRQEIVHLIQVLSLRKCVLLLCDKLLASMLAAVLSACHLTPTSHRHLSVELTTCKLLPGLLWRD